MLRIYCSQDWWATNICDAKSPNFTRPLFHVLRQVEEDRLDDEAVTFEGTNETVPKGNQHSPVPLSACGERLKIEKVVEQVLQIGKGYAKPFLKPLNRMISETYHHVAGYSCPFCRRETIASHFFLNIRSERMMSVTIMSSE
jgi:hypothetical protein